MAKNNKEVEVTVEEATVQEIKEKFYNISKKSSKTLEDITESISLSSVEKVAAVKELTHFIAVQEELARPYGLAQKATKALTSLPWVGKKIESTFTEMKKEHLASASVKEVVYKVYDTMIENGKIITERVNKFYTLREELSSSIEETISLREEVMNSIENKSLSEMDRFELEKMLLTLNNQVIEFKEEIRNLQQIEVVTKGIAMKITENTPANKDRLLRKISAFATISEANNQLNEFKKLRELTTSLDETIQNSIFDTVENVLDNEKTAQKELLLAQKRSESFSKRAKEIDAKLAAEKSNVKMALSMNTERANEMVIEYREEA